MTEVNAEYKVKRSARQASCSPEELGAWLRRWSLQPVDGAKVLGIQKSKMSEYLSGARKVPPYIAAHIITFDQLTNAKATKLIQERKGL